MFDHLTSCFVWLAMMDRGIDVLVILQRVLQIYSLCDPRHTDQDGTMDDRKDHVTHPVSRCSKNSLVKGQVGIDSRFIRLAVLHVCYGPPEIRQIVTGGSFRCTSCQFRFYN